MTPPTIGQELPALHIPITRERLVMYAGASGDFNDIHWSDRAAAAAGLPDVIAHGMLTMAEAVRVVTAWMGDPDCVMEYATRFSRPVVVPDTDEGAELVVTGRVAELVSETVARVEITARVAGDDVLSSAYALVRVG